VSTKNTIQPPNNEQIALYAQLREMLQLPMDVLPEEMEKTSITDEHSARAVLMRRVISEWFQLQLTARLQEIKTAQ
jgi:hypothetical protein